MTIPDCRWWCRYFRCQTFTIAITAVNDVPTLDNIADPAIIIGGNAGEQSVGISGISTGPANESAQTLLITATSNNTLMIPSIAVDYTPGSTTANLRFTPAIGIGGTALITVTVTDNGGTANGGVNTVSKSFSQQISVLLGTLTLSFNKATPQINGTAIQITATVPGGTNKTYKFSATEYYSKVVTPLGTGGYQSSNTVSWTPICRVAIPSVLMFLIVTNIKL